MTDKNVNAGFSAETETERAVTFRKNGRYRNGKTQRTLFIILFLAYPIINWLVFFLYVNIDSIKLAFQTWSISEGKYVNVGWVNFERVLKSFFSADSHPQYRYGIRNSLLIFIWNTFVILPISLLCAYYFYKKVWGEKFFKVVFYLPSIIMPVALCMLFSFMFSTNYGPVNAMLKAMGLGNIIPVNGWFGDPKTCFMMVLWFSLWSGIGYNVIMVAGSMARIPPEVIEAGKIDGITMTKEFTRIIVPLTMPTISTMFMMGIAVSFSYFLPAQLLTNGGPSGEGYTIAYLITNRVSSGNLSEAAAIGWCAAIVGTPLVLLGKFLIDKLVPDVEF